jgi:uncharacterized protein YwqG
MKDKVKNIEQSISILKACLEKNKYANIDKGAFIRSYLEVSKVKQIYKQYFSHSETKELYYIFNEFKKDRINTLPEFLNPFKQEIINNKREYLKILADPISSAIREDPLDLKQSKFLGHPFIPYGSIYPEDNFGNKMILLAQINFLEIPEIEYLPKTGILQLFASPTDWNFGIENYRVNYIDENQINQKGIDDFSFLEESLYDFSPIHAIHKLSFEKANDYGVIGDSQFKLNFNDKSLYGFIEELTEEEKKQFYNFFSSNEHKIGGYSSFIQQDSREISNSGEFSDEFQLLQICYDDQISFGDNGIAHLFLAPDHLKEKEFNHTVFQWDCS